MTEAGASTVLLQVPTSVPAGAPGAVSIIGATAGATPPRQVAANAEAVSIGDKGKARQPNSPPAGKSICKGSPTVKTLLNRKGEPISLGLPTTCKGPILMSVNDPSSSSVPKELPPHQATFNVISEESILSAAGSCTSSEAPSLSFLLDRDTPGPEGLQDSKSDAMEKPPHVLYNSHPRLFEGCPEVQLNNEPITCSVYRYHVPWDPATEYDPIIHYGAVDGIILGRSKEESDLVHDILICWSSPPKDCLWTDMNMALKDFSKISISLHDLKPYDGGKKTVYALNKPWLNEIAQVSLAVHQVLDAFAAFMNFSKELMKMHLGLDSGQHLTQVPEALLVEETLEDRPEVLEMKDPQEVVAEEVEEEEVLHRVSLVLALQVAAKEMNVATLEEEEILDLEDPPAVVVAVEVYFSGGWNRMLLGIWTQFLNDNWVKGRLFEFEEMKFGQKNHNDELPLNFLQRRIQYHSFLYPKDSDGAIAVSCILHTKPTEWDSILNEVTCPSLFILMSTANGMFESLVSSWMLVERLHNPRPYFRGTGKCAAHTVDASPGEFEMVEEESQSSLVNEETKEARAIKARFGGSGRAATNMEVKKPWLEGKMSSKAPNGHCYICTSLNHFTRDCSHYGQWDALRSANMIEVDLEEEFIATSDREYIAMLVESKTSFSAYNDCDKTKEVDVHVCLADAFPNPYYGENRSYRHRVFFAEWNADKMAAHDADTASLPEIPEAKDEDPLAPPKPFVDIVHVCKACSLPDGMGSLGTQALHIKAHVGSPDQDPVLARLDSGADITLISEDYWKSIPGLPAPKEGLCIKLYHLTGNARVLGYIKTTILAETMGHQLASFKLEAHIMRDMKVPLLVGEDFQTTYELGLNQHVMGHCELLVGDSDMAIPASSASSVDLGFEIRKAYSSQSFIRKKAVKQSRAYD
ncbi:hypothetical protein DXG01_001778 [Tephrocybe rancida]|nr:hypothetical protein DXG01_001778 [Tephrocybe rancida]